MSTLDVVGAVFVVGGALAMTAVTLGPAYFLFEVLPKMNKQARKEHFIRLRRERRKDRMKQRREQGRRICLAP